MKKEMSGAGLSYIAKGEGPPIIFIHGWAMAGDIWIKQLKYFSQKGFEAVAIDLRGHGESSSNGPFTISQMAYDLKAFIHEMGYEKPLLVGWSMGAMVLLDYIKRHSRSAIGLVLVGGTPRFTSSEDFPHGLPKKDLSGMKLKLKRDFIGAVGEFRDSMSAELPEVEKEVVSETSLPLEAAAKAGLKELLEADLRDGLEKIAIPTMLIHGGNDKVCLPGASSYMADRIDGSQLVIMEGEGHLPFISREINFNNSLHGFIQGVK